MTTRSRKLIIMALGVILTAGSLTRVAGAATPNEVTPQALGDDPIIVARQDVLDPAATALKTWASTADPGFSDVEVDAMTKGVHVYRVGASPADSVARTYATFVPDGYTVDFKSAVISAARDKALTATVTSLFNNDPGFAGATDWGLTGLGGVFVVHYTGAVAPRVTSDKFPVDLSGVVFNESSETITTAGRLSDTSPYYGGDRIHGPLGAYGCGSSCFASYTGGFGILSPNGSTYFLTPYHDLKPNDTRVWTNANTNNVVIGVASTSHPDLDVAAIKVGSDNKIFDGGFPDQTSTKDVVGVSVPNAGDLVSSGSYAYTICDEQVSTGRTISLPNTYTNVSVAVYTSRIVSRTGRFIWGEGDSGGPVYQNTNGNTNGEGLRNDFHCG